MSASIWETCESPAEKKLLHLLRKGYAEQEIAGQVKLCGYRIDFVTEDRIAWEVDGKDFHERQRDLQRDAVLLASGGIAAVIRIPAGAVHWYWNACVAVFGEWSGVSRFRSPAWDDVECRSRWRDMEESWLDGDTLWCHKCSDVRQFHEHDAFSVSLDTAAVGGALAFVTDWEPYIEASEVALLRHQYVIERRVE